MQGSASAVRGRLGFGALLAAGALAAATAPARPTGVRLVDVVLLAATGAFAAWCGARARPVALLLPAGVAAASARGLAVGPAWGSLVVTVVLIREREHHPFAGAAVMAVAVGCLLRQPSYGFHGASVLVGIAAVSVVVGSAYRASTESQQKTLRRGAAVIGVVGSVATVAFLVVLGLSVGHLSRGGRQARAALDAAREGRSADASSHLAEAESSFRSARGLVGGWWTAPARAVPVVAQHVAAVQTVAEQSLEVTATGKVVASVSDYRDLKYASGRIDLAKVRAIGPPMRDATAVLARSGRSLAGIDRTWLVGPLAERIDALDADLHDAASEADLATEVLDVLPGLLGGSGTRRYFVAFVTPAEARGLGGFLGNYGELTAADGKVRLTASGAISDLEPRAPGSRTLDGPEEYLQRYGRFRPADYFRDATFSPHLPYVADVIQQLYPQAGGRPVDGVITMDPYALAALLRFTGPIQVPGFDQQLTSANAADITLRQQYLEFDNRNEQRKDLLVDATRIAFDRLLGGDLPAPSTLVEVLGPMVRQRRLMFWSPAAPEERLFTRLGADGRMPEAGGGDAFLLAHQNFGNSKIDAYLHRSLRYEARVDQRTGRVTATATITFRNDAPASGLPRYVIGNGRGVPWGTNLMNVTVYSALGLGQASLNGRTVQLTGGREAGLNAYDVVVAVPPGGSSTLVVRLAGGVDLGRGPYRLRLEPQGQVNPDGLQVTVDGRAAISCGKQRRAPRRLTESVTVGAPGCRPAA